MQAHGQLFVLPIAWKAEEKEVRFGKAWMVVILGKS